MLLSDVLTPYGFTPEKIAIFGMVFLIGGLLGAVVFTIIADRTKKFQVCLMVCCIGVAYATSQFTVFIHQVDSFLVISGMFMNAAFSVAFLPVCLNLGIELTFPVTPGIITSSMMISVQISTFLIGMVYNFIMQVSQSIKDSSTPDELAKLEEKRSYIVLYSLVVVCLFICGLCFFLKEDLRRLNYDKAKREGREDEYTKFESPKKDDDIDSNNQIN